MREGKGRRVLLRMPGVPLPEIAAAGRRRGKVSAQFEGLQPHGDQEPRYRGLGRRGRRHSQALLPRHVQDRGGSAAWEWPMSSLAMEGWEAARAPNCGVDG